MSTRKRKNFVGLAQPLAAGKEQALADLVSEFATMTAGCFGLHRDGRFTAAAQDAFWRSAISGLQVLDRFDSAWIRIRDRTPPSKADLNELERLTASAIEALAAVKNTPLNERIGIALAAVSHATDRVDAMLDQVA
jgi:hypothetical protein